MSGSPVYQRPIAPHCAAGFPGIPGAAAYPHHQRRSWWDELEPLFANVFSALGIETGQARALARQVRSVYCNPARWRLFDDALPALDELAARGWTHVILSNHVPELAEFVSRFR